MSHTVTLLVGGERHGSLIKVFEGDTVVVFPTYKLNDFFVTGGNEINEEVDKKDREVYYDCGIKAMTKDDKPVNVFVMHSFNIDHNPHFHFVLTLISRLEYNEFLAFFE